MDLTKYISYFDKMAIGERILLSKFKDPVMLLAAGKMCIDLGYPILFSNDYLEIIRIELFVFPEERSIF